MRLQDVERGFARRQGGVLSHAAFVVDQKAEGFLAAWHEVDGAFEHEDEVLDLAVAGLCVLARGVKI